MPGPFSRLEMLLGKEALTRLQNSRVAVFGLGGVGGFAAEALVRSGIGSLLLVDNDCFTQSNLNRQLLATGASLGVPKVQAAAERFALIAPECRIETRNTFFLPDTADSFDFSNLDYIIDAIDTVSGKLALAEKAGASHIPIISCMGTGNKMDPLKLRVADIYQTSVCPLARVMRRECKKRGISSLKVVYSTEKAIQPGDEARQLILSELAARGEEAGRRDIPGSAIFVPAAAGLLLARTVVDDLINR